MAGDEQRAGQRDAWRKAAAKAAAAKRNGRFQRAAAPIKAGMIRAVVADLSPVSDREPRCSFRGCPVVWTNGGADRPCADHAGADYGTELASHGFQRTSDRWSFAVTGRGHQDGDPA